MAEGDISQAEMEKACEKAGEKNIIFLLEKLSAFNGALPLSRGYGLIVMAHPVFKEAAMRFGYDELADRLYDPLYRVEHPKLSLRDRFALLFGMKPSKDFTFIDARGKLSMPGVYTLSRMT